MSDYSYSAPCVCLRLDPKLAEELRGAVNADDNDIGACSAGQADYIVQMRGLIAKDQAIPFELLKTYWKNHKDGISLFRWTSGCELVLPSLVVPPRSETLEKRCQELRARLKHKEYNSMVAGIDRKPHKGGDFDDGPDGWRQLRRQYVAMINTLVTIGGTFVFFYKAVEYSLPDPNIAAQVLVAILASLVVAVAELYFLLRSI